MANTGDFTVALYGFTSADNLALQRFLKMSAARPRRYTLSQAKDQLHSADIVLAGSEQNDPDARETLAKLNELNVNVPVILITQRPPPGTDAFVGRLPSGIENTSYYAARPLVAARLLRVLDYITVRDLGYVPELSVGAAPDIGVRDLKALWRVARANVTLPPELSVLVVDDSLAVRKQMELILNGAGVKADFAVDGDTALRMNEEKSYDLVFLDVMMPGMDGFGVCRRIRRKNKSVKVVMLTGKGSKINKARGSLAGATAYLTKPVDIVKLGETVTALFANHNASSHGRDLFHQKSEIATT